MRILQHQLRASFVPQHPPALRGGLQLHQPPVGLRRRIHHRLTLHRQPDFILLIAYRLRVGEVIAQRPRHGYLALRRLAQAHADGIAYPVSQQRTDAHCRLDTPVLAFACLRNAQVQREGHALLVHLLHQQTHGIHHHTRVARLHRNHNVHERLAHCHAQKLHHALHHPRRRIPVARHDAVAQAAVVHPEAQCSAVRLAYRQQPTETRVQPLQLCLILLVRVVDMLEFPRRVNVVPGVDTHFLHHLRRRICHIRLKMHIRHQRQARSPQS